MEKLCLHRHSPIEVVQTFCELLDDELDFRHTHGLDALSLRSYYSNLFMADGTLDPLGVYGYASRLMPLLNVLKDANSTVKLLDCGCGYGTESLLFGLSEADVTGVDVVPERVELACSRISFYKNRASQSLKVQFYNADIIRYLEVTQPFNIIWALEAISHIHPLESFLALAFRRLEPGGFLVTSDANALNPFAQYRAYCIRGTHHFRTRVKAYDPSNGKPIYEAVERIFSVNKYKQKLLKIGFLVTGVSMAGFLASSLIPSRLHVNQLVYTILTSAQKMFQKIPVLHLLGTNYTVVARKPF